MSTRRAAHPRSRGENDDIFGNVHGGRGSSPLTRGKRCRGGGRCGVARLIPAHAGKTFHHAERICPSKAHPRSRGENGRCICWRRGRDGSSPLTRGKPGVEIGDHSAHRLIPAHAGKTLVLVSVVRCWTAHPRSRGENYKADCTTCALCGSSPLTRGKLVRTPCTFASRRLIPAHAGKTSNNAVWAEEVEAHPRSRGENGADALALVRNEGSSPLTRGKPSGELATVRIVRLIPAHAGKTDRPVNCMSVTPAHPRSRGENCACSQASMKRRGSSPLTRGKHFQA